MHSERIKGCTRTVGKAQGYQGLPIRDELTLDVVPGEETPVMVTAWQPTPAELQALVKGANIYVHIYGRTHPPIRLTVGQVPG